MKKESARGKPARISVKGAGKKDLNLAKRESTVSPLSAKSGSRKLSETKRDPMNRKANKYKSKDKDKVTDINDLSKLIKQAEKK